MPIHREIGKNGNSKKPISTYLCLRPTYIIFLYNIYTYKFLHTTEGAVSPHASVELASKRRDASTPQRHHELDSSSGEVIEHYVSKAHAKG